LRIVVEKTDERLSICGSSGRGTLLSGERKRPNNGE
jgi:hypothetical protein